MKRFFKSLGIGIVALTTFFASGCGCGCSMKQDDIKTRIQDMRVSNIGEENNIAQDFTADLIYYPNAILKPEEEEIIKQNYKSNFTSENKLVVLTQEGEEPVSMGIDEFTESILSKKFDILKETPYGVYNFLWNRNEINELKKNEKENKDKIDELLAKQKEYIQFVPGLKNSKADNTFLAVLKVKTEAKSINFGKLKKYHFVYDIEKTPMPLTLDIEITTTKNNKITRAIADVLMETKNQTLRKPYLDLTIDYIK